MAVLVLLEQGRQALLAGDLQAAIDFLESCLQQADDAEAWFLLGAARHRMQDLHAAKEAFKEVTRLEPRHLQALFALAGVCLELGEIHAALAACEAAVAIAPDDPQAWFNLAVAQEAGALAEQALVGYDRVLTLSPAHAGAFKNRGALLLRLGRKDAAVASAKAMAQRLPYSFDAQFDLGSTCLAVHRHAEAVNAFARALALQPDNARALLHAGFALAQCERFDEAQRSLDRAAALDSSLLRSYRESIFGSEGRVPVDHLDARVLFLLRHYDAIERCDWRERSYFLERFSALIGNPEGPPLVERALAFRGMALGLDSSLQSALAKQIAVNYLRAAGQADNSPDSISVAISTKKHMPQIRQRLRIGYLSGDYRSHATAWLMSRMPGLHDRDRFEVFLYSTGPDDGSVLRTEIIAGADSFIYAQNFSDTQLAAAIEKDEIDILVDLAGYTQHSRPGVLALRPAPLQVSYLVYLQTSGADWMDYVILDRQVLTPETRKFWVEKIAYLPHTLYICNDRHSQTMHVRSRAEEGLPEGAFVFACLNAPWKIEPETLACWAEILRRIPNSVLWLYADREEVEINLREAGNQTGIASERMIFARKVLHEEHLSRYQYADVFLDTFSCNAHTTAIEALSAGVPVVTLQGETVVSRVGSSLLSAHGLDGLVANTPTRYIDIACRLAEDPTYFKAIKARVMNFGVSRLFATELRVRELEAAYTTMWARYSGGLPTGDFDVPAITPDDARREG